MKKLLVIFLLISIAVASFFTIKSLTKEEVALEGYIFRVSDFNRYYKIFDITNEKKLVSKEESSIYTKGLPIGSYKYLFSSPNRKDVTIIINGAEKKDFTVSFEVANQDVNDMQILMGDRSGIVIEAKYFANKTWLLGYLADDTESASSYEVKVLKKTGLEWKSVVAGTDLNSEYLKLLGAPADLISYLEKGR